MAQRTYSGAYSRRRYSNISATTTAAGSGLSTDPNAGGSARRYTLEASSNDPNMGVVQVTVLSEVVNVNAGTTGADYSALGGSNTFVEGTVVEVYAKAKPGYRFVSWDHNLPTGTGRQGNPMRVTINKNIVMKANFAMSQAQTRTINVSWNDAMGRVQANGMQNGQLSVASGSTVTLNANPNPGYHFVKWTGGPANGTQTTAHYTFQANSNYNIAAVFAKNADSPVDVDPSGTDTTDPFTPNYGGGGGGGGTQGSETTDTGLIASTSLIDKVKPFVKKWWWAILIVAYIVYKERKGGAK